MSYWMKVGPEFDDCDLREERIEILRHSQRHIEKWVMWGKWVWSDSHMSKRHWGLPGAPGS